MPGQLRQQRHPVQTIKVRPDVWRAALKAAEGDPRRIVIINERRVEVRPPAEG